MKTISKEEIESHANKLFVSRSKDTVDSQSKESMYKAGFVDGTDYTIDQLQQPPQSGELMTLEEMPNEEDILFKHVTTVHNLSDVTDAMHEYAVLYSKAKSDQLQTRVDDLLLLKEHLEAKYASLMLSLREEELVNKKFKDLIEDFDLICDEVDGNLLEVAPEFRQKVKQALQSETK